MRENPSESDTRPSLLLRIRDASDDEAWTVFVDVYAPLVHGYCRRHGLHDADAADVTQEALMQVAQSVRQFDYQPERGRFRDWLGVVARGKLSRFVARRERVTTQTDLEEVSAPPDPVWAQEFATHILRTALARIEPSFEPATWKAFTRAWLEDQPAAAVSRELDLPVESVYVAKSRVLKRLREEVLLLAEDIPQCVPLQ
jgi:RNA polymerase sigma factor (sigma-70 family)